MRTRRGVSTVIGMTMFILLVLVIGGFFLTLFVQYNNYLSAVKKFNNAQTARGLDNVQITSVGFGSSATRGPYDARYGPATPAPNTPYAYSVNPACHGLTDGPLTACLSSGGAGYPYPASITFPLSFSSAQKLTEDTPIQNMNFTSDTKGWTSDVVYPSGFNTGLGAGFDPTGASVASIGSPSGPGVVFTSVGVNPATTTSGFGVIWKYQTYVQMSNYGFANPCISSQIGSTSGGNSCPKAYFSFSRFISGFWASVATFTSGSFYFNIQDPAGNVFRIPVAGGGTSSKCPPGEVLPATEFCYTSSSTFDSQWVATSGVNSTLSYLLSGPLCSSPGVTCPTSTANYRVFSLTGFYVLSLQADYQMSHSGGGNPPPEVRFYFDDIGIGLYFPANVVDQVLEYIVPGCQTSSQATNSTMCPTGVTGEAPSILSNLQFSFLGSAGLASSSAVPPTMYIYVNAFQQSKPTGTPPTNTYTFVWYMIGKLLVSSNTQSFQWNNGVFDVRLFVNQAKEAFGSSLNLPAIPAGAVQFRFYLINPQCSNGNCSPGYSTSFTFTINSGSSVIDSWPNQNNVTLTFQNFSNFGGATSHLVSLWIINSTTTINYNTQTTPRFELYLRPGEMASLSLNYHWIGGAYTFILVTDTGGEFTFATSR